MEGQLRDDLAAHVEDLQRLFHHLERRPECGAELEETRCLLKTARRLAGNCKDALAVDFEDDALQAELVAESASMAMALDGLAERFTQDAATLRASRVREVGS